MKPYYTKAGKLSGTRWAEIYKKAFAIYKQIKRRTKRRPYIRSAYFKKDKIFLELFWSHLHEKENLRDKTRRVKYFACAIELIQHSISEPKSKENPNNEKEVIHRFAGISREKKMFFVQVKEEKRTGKKWLISVFPLDK